MIELLYRRILKKLKLNNFERNQLKGKTDNVKHLQGPLSEERENVPKHNCSGNKGKG